MNEHDQTGAAPTGGREAAVGLDIGADGLRMVRVSRGRIHDFAFAPFEAGFSPASEGFAGFLRRHVGSFCGHMLRGRLWAGCAFPSMQVRRFTVPRVPPRQLANAVYWTFRKELPFNERETIFDFMLEDEVVEDGVKKLAVTAYTVLRSEVDLYKSVFDKAGLSVDGMTVPFFALRNIFWSGWVGELDATAACLDMGGDSSQVTVFSRKRTAMTRVIKAGVSTVVEAARSESVSGVKVEELRAFLLSGECPAGAGEDRRKALIEEAAPALIRLARQVERTLEAHFVGRASEHVKRIYVTGAVTACRPVLDFLGSQLGVVVEAVDPLDPGRLARRAAERPPEKGSGAQYAAAAGLALSDEAHTPNLLRTRREKDAEQRVGRLNTGIVLACAVLLGLLGGVVALGRAMIRDQRREISRIEERIGEFSPSIERNSLTRAATKSRLRRETLKEAALAAMPVALVKEIAGGTPAHIRLTAISISTIADDAGKGRGEKGRGGSAREGGRVSAVVEGRVLGPKEDQEARLAGYALSLGRSELVASVKTGKTKAVADDEGEFLVFRIEMLAAGGAGAPAGAERGGK